jgi:hypothetical protein
MPGRTGADLFKVNVLTVEQHLAQYPLIAVQIVFHHHNLTSNQIGEMRLRFGAESLLSSLWGIDSLEVYDSKHA